MVCAECAIGLEIILGTPYELLGDVGQVEAHLVSLEIVLISAQDRCTNWDEHTIGLEIILGTPYGTLW
jgi:hypothetical protein